MISVNQRLAETNRPELLRLRVRQSEPQRRARHVNRKKSAGTLPVKKMDLCLSWKKKEASQDLRRVRLFRNDM